MTAVAGTDLYAKVLLLGKTFGVLLVPVYFEQDELTRTSVSCCFNFAIAYETPSGVNVHRF